ncbi:MAG: glucose-1-phosphate adenylyltransferase subunit GlgD [Oscillospiraceae bacterium]|nr:glucose-1-phosphate adenylyltransferase subunit GlgD [Oscillospiraceae bacterium]
MSVLGIIFANIYDSSMGELTNKRTMASLPFGGRYRQIDFSLSNMTNSGIRRIGILSRYNYQSLMAHIGSGEEWDLELQEGGLEYLTPYALAYSSANYRGKLEALNSVLEYMSYGSDDDYVVLADSSVLCNIDIGKVLDSHIVSGKDITVVTKEGIANGKKRLDLAVKLDSKGGIADMVVDYPASADYLASMGLFIISKDLLMKHVQDAVAHNLYRFERDFLLNQYQAGNLSVNIYQFGGVALYNESPAEYYRSNLSILDKDIRHDLFSRNHPIYTKVRDRVPSYYGEDCHVENCSVADGCILEGTVRNSVLFRQVSIGAGTLVEDCVIMNDTVVGENCELKCVILDKDVTVRPGSKLIGTPNAPVIIKRGETV